MSGLYTTWRERQVGVGIWAIDLLHDVCLPLPVFPALTPPSPTPTGPPNPPHPFPQSSLVASSKKGDVYVFNNGEMTQHLADVSGDRSSVLCLATRPFGTGVVAGAANGVVTIYGREVPLQSQVKAGGAGAGAAAATAATSTSSSSTRAGGNSRADKMSLRSMFRYRIEHRLRIKRPFVRRLVGVSIFRANMEEDELLAFCFPDNIGTLTIGDANLHLVGPASRSASPVLGATTAVPGPGNDAAGDDAVPTKEAEDVSFLFGEYGVHFGAVTSMDICRNKAILASCSAQDMTVRLWDYKVREWEGGGGGSERRDENDNDASTNLILLPKKQDPPVPPRAQIPRRHATPARYLAPSQRELSSRLHSGSRQNVPRAEGSARAEDGLFAKVGSVRCQHRRCIIESPARPVTASHAPSHTPSRHLSRQHGAVQPRRPSLCRRLW